MPGHSQDVDDNPPPPYTGSSTDSDSDETNDAEPMIVHARSLSKGGSLFCKTGGDGKPRALYEIKRTKRHFWSKSKKSKTMDLQIVDSTKRLTIGTIHFRYDRHIQKIALTFPQTGHDIMLTSGVFESKHGNGGIEDDTITWAVEDVALNKSRNGTAFSHVLLCRNQETGLVLCKVVMSRNAETANIQITDPTLEQRALDELIVSAVAEMERFRRTQPSLIRRLTKSLTMTFD